MNTNFEEPKTLFDITLRLIVEQSLKILTGSTMMWNFSPWIDPLCWTTQWSSGRKQRYMSTQIQSCVWRRCMIIQKRIRSGKLEPKTSNNPTSTQRYSESMENQLSLSEIFSQDAHQKIQEDLEVRQIHPEQLEGGIPFMPMFNDIDWTKNGNSFACISNSKEEKVHAKRFQRGNWSFFGPGNEEKWYGTFCHKQEGKCYNEANQMIEHLKQSGHPVLLEERHFTSQRNQQTLNFHFAQLTRQISSVSTEQYRVGVMTWLKRCLVRHPWQWTNPFQKINDLSSKQLNSQEVGSLVQNQTRTEEAAGNSWRDHIQRFKMQDPDEQFRAIRESAGFIGPVSVGMYYRSSDDVNDWKSNIIMQRICTTSWSVEQKTYRDRTSSWSQIFLSHWRLWNRDSDHLYIWR